MDPAATLAIVNDESAPSDERDHAALDLLVWIAKGGEISLHVEGLRPKADTIQRCENRLRYCIDMEVEPDGSSTH
jgi:hypothetical protein